MITPEMLQSFPLTLLTDGTIRVKGSRDRWKPLWGNSNWGASPEHICESFPSLSLREVYGALFFYLNHEADVDAYLQPMATQLRLREVKRKIDVSSDFKLKPRQH